MSLFISLAFSLFKSINLRDNKNLAKITQIDF